jgi:hypothetical protein
MKSYSFPGGGSIYVHYRKLLPCNKSGSRVGDEGSSLKTEEVIMWSLVRAMSHFRRTVMGKHGAVVEL